MKIYIMRHGETDWNKELKIQGKIDNPLNQTGINQAKEKANYFKNKDITYFISSSLSRAKDTLNIVMKENNFNQNTLINDNFIERDFGELETQSVEVFYDAKDVTVFKNYETDEQIINRTYKGLQEVSQLNSNTLIVAHSHVIKSILTKVDPSTYNFNYSLANCAIVELEYKDNKFKVISIN